MNLDDQKIDITCPSCRRKRSETVRKLKTNPALTCLCGTTLEIDKNQLSAGLKSVEKSLSNIKRVVRRFNK